MSDSAREAMVRDQIEARGVSCPRVLAAMGRVPRHAFVPTHLRAEAYEDCPLPIGAGQTISQPFVVARMTEALQLAPTDRVLEIGCGSGYQAAILGELVQEVHTVERIPSLARAARQRLAALGYANVHVHTGDGALGWPARSPYQGILVACGAPALPSALVEQLALGARLVIPLGPLGGVQDLVRITKVAPDRTEQEVLFPVRFVPLLPGDPSES